MKRLSILAACLVLALAIAASASAAATRSCPGTFDGGFFTGLKATGVSCKSASALLKRWMTVTDFKKKGGQPGTVHVGAWTCTLRVKGESGSVSCRSGAKRVSWRGHP